MTAETLITILSASGVVLVTIYNVVSSKHYRKAKQAQVDSLQATINSKQAEIDTTKHFTSSQVFAEYQAQKAILEPALDKYKKIVAKRDEQIAALLGQVADLVLQKDRQTAVAAALQQKIGLAIQEYRHQKYTALTELSTELHSMVEPRRPFKDLLTDVQSLEPEPPST